MESDSMSLLTSGILDGTAGSMSKDEYVSELLPKIQAILNAEFPGESQKRKIKVYKDRIAFAAPCCGDSAHDAHKKRGNIILEGRFRNMYKCHNCGSCMPVYKFFRAFGQDLSLGTITYISNTNVDYSSNGSDGSINAIYDVDAIERVAIDRNVFREVLGLEECSVPNLGHQYLAGRCQYDWSKFMYSPKYSKLFILNLTPSGKVFGMQTRPIGHTRGGAKYKTYGIRKLYEMIFSKVYQDVPEISDGINELSMIFNILLIDYNRIVTVTEGPMDSFLVNNSVALLGAGKHVSFPFRHRYLFDDDEPGRKHAIDRINEGYEIFLWSRFRKDLGIPDSKKWDMNDVVKWAHKNNVKLPWLDGYFSSNVLDMMDL